VTLVAIDFSFNEDHEQRYLPFWSPHFYLITSTDHRKTLSKTLCRLFSKTDEIPRPVWVPTFRNKAHRRSYALKMRFIRRIGYWEIRKRKGKIGKYRNAGPDKLRAGSFRATNTTYSHRGTGHPYMKLLFFVSLNQVSTVSDESDDFFELIFLKQYKEKRERVIENRVTFITTKTNNNNTWLGQVGMPANQHASAQA